MRDCAGNGASGRHGEACSRGLSGSENVEWCYASVPDESHREPQKEGGAIWEEDGGRASEGNHDQAQLYTGALAFRI